MITAQFPSNIIDRLGQKIRHKIEPDAERSVGARSHADEAGVALDSFTAGQSSWLALHEHLAVTSGTSPHLPPKVRPRPHVSSWLAPVFALTSLIAAEAQAGICGHDGRLHQASQDILTLTALRLQLHAPEAWSVEQGNEFAQSHLLRPKGEERLSDAAVEHYRALYERLTSQDADILTNNLRAVGLVHAIKPPPGHYDYILLNGSTAQNVRRRIQSVADALANGALTLVPETKIIFLDGERTLFASETAKVLLDPSPFIQDPAWTPPARLPQDERAMNEMLWQQMLLPKTLRDQGILFVHAQKKEGTARAETADCVAAWVKSHQPGPGRALVVSSNPTIEYQKRVTEILLAKSGVENIKVECMGPEAQLSQYDPAVRLGLLLDAFAGTLFRAKQENELRR